MFMRKNTAHARVVGARISELRIGWTAQKQEDVIEASGFWQKRAHVDLL